MLHAKWLKSSDIPQCGPSARFANGSCTSGSIGAIYSSFLLLRESKVSRPTCEPKSCAP